MAHASGAYRDFGLAHWHGWTPRSDQCACKNSPFLSLLPTQMSGVFFSLGPGSGHPNAHVSLQLETGKSDETRIMRLLSGLHASG